MRRLLHLLWILPLLLLLAAGAAALSTSLALDRHEEFHDALPRSLTVRSDDFRDGGRIPTELTCRGRGISPHVEWSGAPPVARSFVLVETDWDVPSPSLRLFRVAHWVLYDIPPDVQEIPGGATNAELREMGITVGTAAGGSEGYYPSCPPSGTHAYELDVYALDVASLNPASPTRDGVMEALEGHVLTYGRLVGTHSPE